MEEFAADRTDRDQPVGASLVQLHEQAKTLHARDAAGKFRPDPVSQIGGKVAIGRVAFRHHRAALSLGDQLGGLIKVFDIPRRQAIIDRAIIDRAIIDRAILTPAMPGDQRAMHDQVGIAPDGRGEMGVVPQRQPEMAEILGAVIGLRHRPQGRDVHQLVKFGALGLRQQPIQMRGMQHLPLGQREPRRLGHFAQ